MSLHTNSTISTFLATNGVMIAKDSPKLYTYAGPGGACNTITITNLLDMKDYRRTLGYTGSDVTSDTGWVLVVTP